MQAAGSGQGRATGRRLRNPWPSQDNALTRQGEEIIQANLTAVHSFGGHRRTAMDSRQGGERRQCCGSMASMIGAGGLAKHAHVASPHSQDRWQGISYAGQWLRPARHLYGGIRQQQIQGDAA